MIRENKQKPKRQSLWGWQNLACWLAFGKAWWQGEGSFGFECRDSYCGDRTVPKRYIHLV